MEGSRIGGDPSKVEAHLTAAVRVEGVKRARSQRAEAGAAVDNLLVELLYLVVIMDIDNLLDPTGREELIEIEARTLTRLERVLQDRLRKALAKH